MVATLPAAPAPTDSAITFPGIANTFFAALQTMVSEVNVLTATFVVLPTPLSTLPAGPSSTSFVSGADAFVAGLPGLVSDVNGMITELGLGVAAVTTLPATPSRTSDPGNFTTEGPAFLVAMTELQADLNAFIAALNAYDPMTPAGGDLRTVVGNSQYIAQSADSSGLGRLVKITAPSGSNSLLSAVQVEVSSIGGAVGMKALLVADNAGVPSSTVIAIGTATVPGVAGVVSLPFASPETLTAGTAYWIGFAPSATMAVVVDNGSFSGNADGYAVAVTYASPTWDSSTDVLGSKYSIWANCEQSGAASGLHQQGSSVMFVCASTMRIAMPPCAIGDTVRVNFGQDFGTLPTTPSGFTKTYDDQISSFAGLRHVIYTRVIDGTENGTIGFDAPSGNDRIAVATVFRGGGSLEGKTANTGTGTAVTSAAVTPANTGRVFNFVMSGFNGGTVSSTESADTWTDVYNLTSTVGNKHVASLSYKDVTAAGSSGTESRTVNNGFWHVTSFAIPDA